MITWHVPVSSDHEINGSEVSVTVAARKARSFIRKELDGDGMALFRKDGKVFRADTKFKNGQKWFVQKF